MSSDAAPTSMTETYVVGVAYIRTIQGICKIVQVVSSLIAALLVGIGFYGYLIRIFEICASVSIVVGILYLIFHISGVIVKFGGYVYRNVFYYNVIWSIYYLVAVIYILSEGGYYSQIVAGGVFGLIATIAHIVDAVDSYRKQPLC